VTKLQRESKYLLFGVNRKTDWVGEYESLQELHQWKIDFLRADRLELTYSKEIRLHFNCSAFTPDLSSVGVSLLGSPSPVSNGMLGLLRANIEGVMRSSTKISLAQVRLSLRLYNQTRTDIIRWSSVSADYGPLPNVSEPN
jgi:hypothetical protein